MDQPGKPSISKPPDSVIKLVKGDPNLGPSSLVGSQMSSRDHSPSKETSPLNTGLAENSTQANEVEEEENPAVIPEIDETEDADDASENGEEEEEEDVEEDAEEEEVKQEEQRGPRIRNVNFPRCPDKSLLPPPHVGESKYVVENPKQEDIFKILLRDTTGKSSHSSPKVVIIRNVKLGEYGMSFPRGKNDEKLSLNNISETFTELQNSVYKVPNFKTDQKQSIGFKALIEKINKGGDEGFNCLECEITKRPKLNEMVEIPALVKGHSMVLELKRAIKTRLSEIAKELKGKGNTTKLQGFNHEKEELNRMKKKLPTYEKFFIFSMKNAFTNLHVDFGGTFVYYYVFEGVKAFWLAEGTDANLKVYKRLERKHLNIWEAEPEFLMNNFEQHVLRTGDLALIPCGFLHFVHTLVKSLVFGGNFLNLNCIRKHFEITRFEEECKVKAEKYKDFWDVQFAYVKYVWLKEVEFHFKFGLSLLPQECVDNGQLFLEELQKEEKNTENKLFTPAQRREILKELRAALAKGTPKVKSNQSKDRKRCTKSIEMSSSGPTCCNSKKLKSE